LCHLYLLGKRFQIKTDHQSLKYFLKQCISSQEQQKWVTKLFGYDYEIIYKKGKDNVVADALSQKYEDEGSFFSLSFIGPDWLQAVREEWLQDPKSSHLIQQLQNKAPAPLGYSWLQDELRYKGRLYLSKQSKLKSTMLSELHAIPTAGHSGFTKTYDRVKHSFFWDGMKQDIRKFVAECEVCQCNKGETVKSLGTLQLLSIPPAIWKDISMDFITSLPKSGNKSVIMVVVDRLSKYAHFCALPHPFLHPWWLKFSWTRSSSCMACHTLLFPIETQLSQAIFGRNCLSYKAHNCISAQLIIPKWMVKRKLSTSVWKHI
jgi:hypothetical protein